MNVRICAKSLLGVALSLWGATFASAQATSCDPEPAALCDCTAEPCAAAVSCDTGCSSSGLLDVFKDCGSQCGCDPCGSCGKSSGACGCGGGLCGGSNGCCDESLFGFGIVKPGEKCFNDFITPITNTIYFEDPRTLTEARFVFANHMTPTLGPGLPTARVNLFALQLRAALTDRLSLIAIKDGFIVSQSPLIDDGWADVAAGLKYNLYRDPTRPLLVSTGFTFELPVGSTRSLQGNGDGEFNMFLTGMGMIRNWHWVTIGGLRLPTDSSAENQISYWSGHLDRKIYRNIYFLTETNWYHWMKSGTAFPLPVEGGDLFNLGSVGVAGNDIVTQAFGTKIKPRNNMELGVAFEFPLTERRGVLDNRLTLDWILRY
ncbi:MAG: hypothetical protein U0795_15105 [Pirellulales bacterium]